MRLTDFGLRFSRCRGYTGFSTEKIPYVLEPRLKVLRCLIVLSLVFASNLWARADSLGEVSKSFWQWRAQEQPFTGDDIPRIDRPVGMTVDWSAKTIGQRLEQLAAFEQQWKSLA